MYETQAIAIVHLGGATPLDANEVDTPIGFGVYVRYNDGCDEPEEAGRVTLIASAGAGFAYHATPAQARIIANAILVAAEDAEDEIRRRKRSESDDSPRN